jgi:hypothetical protein
VILLLLAAVPRLFWEGAVDTAPMLREAGIHQILVPPARLAAWKDVTGITVEAADPKTAVKVPPPAVNYRINEASATRSPWLVSNGWKFLRRPDSLYLYETSGKQAALAAAEAFAYGVKAAIHTDSDGLKPLAAMLDFLRSIPGEDMPPVADIGYIDDGSPLSGEVINLMVRDNLLFHLVKSPDPKLKVNVKLGTRDYPLQDARNPGMVAHEVRASLTDEKRSVRVYGSSVVLVRLTALGDRARLHLLNYAGAERRVDGLRVRVLGQYSQHQLFLADGAGVELIDYSVMPYATEFTLPELKTYAVIDLSR